MATQSRTQRQAPPRRPPRPEDETPPSAAPRRRRPRPAGRPVRPRRRRAPAARLASRPPARRAAASTPPRRGSMRSAARPSASLMIQLGVATTSRRRRAGARPTRTSIARSGSSSASSGAVSGSGAAASRRLRRRARGRARRPRRPPRRRARHERTRVPRPRTPSGVSPSWRGNLLGSRRPATPAGLRASADAPGRDGCGARTARGRVCAGSAGDAVSRFSTSAGERIADPEVIERLRELAIPPAWQDVWICSDPLGHLQATGRRRRRPQAVPLPPALARAPRPRKVRADGCSSPNRCRSCGGVLAQELDGAEPTRERVLACAVRLLDVGLFRDRRRGVRGRRGRRRAGDRAQGARHACTTTRSCSTIPAKGGVRRVQAIEDPLVRELLIRLKRRRGRAARAARLPRGTALARRALGRHQRVPQGSARGGLQRQGLPDLERDRAGGGVARHRRRAMRRPRPRASGRRPSGQGRRRAARATRRPSRGGRTSIRACSIATSPVGRSGAALERIGDLESPDDRVRSRIERAVLDLLAEHGNLRRSSRRDKAA